MRVMSTQEIHSLLVRLDQKKQEKQEGKETFSELDSIHLAAECYAMKEDVYYVPRARA